MECKKLHGMCPNMLELTGDYLAQASRKATTPSAIAYFPKSKFLCYSDFVLRVLYKTKEGEKDLMVLVVGQITLSLPTDHNHTWNFFESDYFKMARRKRREQTGCKVRPSLVYFTSNAGLDFILIYWSANAG